MEDPGFEQSMAEEEPTIANEHPLACSLCDTKMIPALAATKIRRRVNRSTNIRFI